VFEFGENRVPFYPATAAVFIAKFDLQTSLHLDCAIGSWVKLKYPANTVPCDFNLIQSTSYQLAQNSGSCCSDPSDTGPLLSTFSCWQWRAISLPVPDTSSFLGLPTLVIGRQ